MPEQANAVVVVPPEDGLQVPAVLERHLADIVQALRQERLLEAAPVAKHLAVADRPVSAQRIPKTRLPQVRVARRRGPHSEGRATAILANVSVDVNLKFL